jgi:hypothetical protein
MKWVLGEQDVQVLLVHVLQPGLMVVQLAQMEALT